MRRGSAQAGLCLLTARYEGSIKCTYASGYLSWAGLHLCDAERLQTPMLKYGPPKHRPYTLPQYVRHAPAARDALALTARKRLVAAAACGELVLAERSPSLEVVLARTIGSASCSPACTDMLPVEGISACVFIREICASELGGWTSGARPESGLGVRFLHSSLHKWYLEILVMPSDGTKSQILDWQGEEELILAG